MKTTRGVIPLIAAVVGVVVLGWSFVTGISAALDGGGSGALPYTIAFLVALAVVLTSAILAIVNLIRKRSVALAAVTLVIAAVPIIAVLVIWILNLVSAAG